MKSRPPVVTILGHVDHGKTTLLDFIRKSKLAAKEHGGITQRIGAYEIEVPLKGYATNKLTFIDTPGHEAFSKLRARGAHVADIAILIIDAKDSIMPQTIESISHIKSANIPFIVVLNKVDLPDANPEKVKNDLIKHNVITEDKGGTVPTIEISAKTGKNVTELLETLLLMASELKLEFDPKAPLKAFIIETKKDKRGTVVSAIVKDGMLKTSDTIFTGDKKTRVRSLINDLGEPVSEVEPSTPVEILGFEYLPEVGMEIHAESTTTIKTQGTDEKKKSFTLESILHVPEEAKKRLSLIIKADTQGTLEAIIYTLAKNDNIDIILSAVGEVNRSDVFLAKTTNAIIIGFGVTISNEVKELAKQEKTIIKTYNVIYELVDELSEVADLLREKEIQEKSVKGEAKILATFIIEGEKIYGVKATKGRISLGDSVEVYRDNNVYGKTKLVSLKQRAKSVQEIKKEEEAGMVFSPPLDIKVGDVIKSIL